MLFDVSSYGHHGQYILQLVDYWVKKDMKGTLNIVIPGTMVSLHPRLERMAMENESIRLTRIDRPHASRSGGAPEQVQDIRRHGKLLRRYVELLRPDHCLLMYFDQAQVPLAAWMRFSFPVRMSGIYFRPSFHYALLAGKRPTLRDKVVSLGKRFVLHSALRNRHFHTLFCLDPYVVPHIRAAPHGTVVHLADGIPHPKSRSRAGQHRDIQDERRTALFFGSVAPRKGIFETLAALLLLSPECQETLCLIVAGRIPEAVKPVVAAAARETRVQIVVMDRFIADEEISGLFASSDLVLVPYPRHVGSSGVLVRAVAAQKPVLGSDYGLVGAHIRRHSLGRAVDCTSPPALASALQEWLTDPKTIALDTDKAVVFAATHTAEHFCRTIMNHLALESAETANLHNQPKAQP